MEKEQLLMPKKEFEEEHMMNILISETKLSVLGQGIQICNFYLKIFPSSTVTSTILLHLTPSPPLPSSCTPSSTNLLYHLLHQYPLPHPLLYQDPVAQPPLIRHLQLFQTTVIKKMLTKYIMMTLPSIYVMNGHRTIILQVLEDSERRR